MYIYGILYNIISYQQVPSRIVRGQALVNAFFIILELDAVPSHSGSIYVNFKAKVHAANTFCVGYSSSNETWGF